VSSSFELDRTTNGKPDGAQGTVPMPGDGQESDALPVLAEQPTVVRAAPLPGTLTENRKPALAVIPAAQAAAVAAGGFVAGAAIIGLMHRYRRSSALSTGRRAGRGVSRRGRGRRPAGRGGERVNIVGSRSFLVDVHLLGQRDR